jgi:hypothetical protein
MAVPENWPGSVSVTCAHFTNPDESYCTQGISYQQLAGGGAFSVVLRLPCLPLSNRRGEVTRTCTKYQALSADDKTGDQG